VPSIPVNLKALPVNHPLRNRPLGEMYVEYRWNVGKGGTWRECKPTFGVAKCTFNQLGPVWTTWDDWRIIVVDTSVN
jgi:hypothetical protein